MRILVTGCSGYIGSQLVPRLRALHHEVIGIDRAPWPGGGELDRFICADLRDTHRWDGEMDGVEYVCHLAAAKGDWGISDAGYRGDNVDATRSLLQVGHARGIGKWLFYSTVSVLGPSDAPKEEDAPFAPTHAYGRTKAEAEKLFQRFVAEDHRRQVTVLRPSVVYGPDNPDNTNIFRLIEAIHRGRFLMIGDGETIKTTSYIDNVIAATLFLLDGAETGLRVYHYIDEPRLPTGELVGSVYRLLHKRRPRWSAPLSVVKPVAWLGDIAGAVAHVDFPITRARIEKFCTATDFAARAIRARGFEQPVDNEAALQATVAWYLERCAGPRSAWPPSRRSTGTTKRIINIEERQ